MTTIKQFCESHKIGCTSDYASENPQMDDRGAKMNNYRVKLRSAGKTMSLYFSKGIGLEGEPTADDVLECLQSDASLAEYSFEDFCGELGYDTDSRTAERSHKQTIKQTDKLRRWLGDEFDAFMACEQD